MPPTALRITSVPSSACELDALAASRDCAASRFASTFSGSKAARVGMQEVMASPRQSVKVKSSGPTSIRAVVSFSISTRMASIGPS